jgi:hypothetical protein
VTQAAAAHPLLTSLVLGALGTVLASVTNSSSGTTSKADVSDKRANGSAAPSEAPL